MSIQTHSLLDRTIRNLRSGWRAIAGNDYSVETASHRPDLPDDDLPAIREQISACLEGKGGEVSARARAANLGHVYLALETTGQQRFLKTLNDEYGPDKTRVETAIKQYQEANNAAEHQSAEREIRRSLESPRLRLLRQFNDLPDGVKFLVDMRAQLLELAAKDASLSPLEEDMRHLLKRWFDIGFLELKRITWDTASAALLEKLIAYEAVHTIESWDDLKNRLDSDRRCFAYFHPKMPDEPLIFVEVALVNGLASSVQALLDKNAPVQDSKSANTAIFYSISNAQKGLAGISFGNFLIKRVAAQLSQEFPTLKTFATLSPIPGYMGWLRKALMEEELELAEPTEQRSLKEIAETAAPNGSLLSLIKDNQWIKDESLTQALQSPLTRLAAHYLTEQKGRDTKRARDPVAHFHLSNGAIIEKLNWMGDKSGNGLTQSAGLMVNYLYDLDRIDENHEAYSGAGKITVSPEIKNLI